MLIINTTRHLSSDFKTMMHSYLQGLSVALSLIVAIGAQNAFILKQGLLKQHIFWLCVICALSDSILLAAGIFGFAKLVLHYPEVVKISTYLGAVFLGVYGAQHLYKALFKSEKMDLTQSDEIDQPNLKKLIFLCLVLTWLNPHVYLDTVVLVGSISTHFEAFKLAFLCGAVTASWLFFFALGYGSRYLLPIFQSEGSWKILDFIIGLMMWWIAYHLVF